MTAQRAQGCIQPQDFSVKKDGDSVFWARTDPLSAAVGETGLIYCLSHLQSALGGAGVSSSLNLAGVGHRLERI